MLTQIAGFPIFPAKLVAPYSLDPMRHRFRLGKINPLAMLEDYSLTRLDRCLEKEFLAGPILVVAIGHVAAHDEGDLLLA